MCTGAYISVILGGEDVSEERKGLNSSMNTLQEIEIVRGGFQLGGRVSVTQLGRSTEWRETLKEMSALEVVDRNQTAAVLLKPETYKAIWAYLQEMESELEHIQIEMLLSRREKMDNWASGDDLSARATANFTERRDKIRRFLDGDQ